MSEFYYYGHGKVLLTSEYFVLEGAKALALPTTLGQKMHITYRPTSQPKLFWKSYDHDQKLWFEAVFELWHFDVLSFNEELVSEEDVLLLQKILRQARAQNIHFLREDVDVYATTTLEFPRLWGLGTSSTIIYCIAQWAYVSPFELLEKTFGGSGYDIACAQSMGPILYQNQKRGPQWETVTFNPLCKENIYFIYLNQKQSSREGIERFKGLDLNNKQEIINKLNDLTYRMLNAIDLSELEEIIIEHETIISHALDLPSVKKTLFKDFWGQVKSLGAWGGDFVMATSDRSKSETLSYFADKGYNEVLSFDQLILQNFGRYGSKAEKLESELNHVIQS